MMKPQENEIFSEEEFKTTPNIESRQFDFKVIIIDCK